MGTPQRIGEALPEVMARYQHALTESQLEAFKRGEIVRISKPSPACEEVKVVASITEDGAAGFFVIPANQDGILFVEYQNAKALAQLVNALDGVEQFGKF